jgi:hypothetical protein
MLRYDAPRRQERKEPPHRFAHDRHARDALVPAASDDQDFSSAFSLLHAQPGFGTLHRLRGRRQRRPEIQCARSPESQLIERVLQ